MEKDLEAYLETLNSDKCVKNPKEAIFVLEKITKCFSQEKSQFTIGLLISVLLKEKNGIFTFIWKSSSEFETSSAVSSAFKLLDFLLSNFQKSLEPYFFLLFQKCLRLFSSKFAKVKAASLKLIKDMVVADSKHSLDLPVLISALEKHLKEETKIPGTVLDHIYSILGYIFEFYPESVKNEKWFFRKMCESLEVESRSGKNSCVSTVKGAFEGINGYLTNYLLPDVEITKKIYRYIKGWSNFHEEKKVASRIALKILQNHWTNFCTFIYNDKDFWRNNVDIWIKQKKEDSVFALKFLCAFYSVIVLFIKQESNVSEAKSFLKEFTDALNSDANLYEKKAALVGIKLFVLTDCLTKEDYNEVYEVLVNFIRKQETRKYVSCLPLTVECISTFALKYSKENLYTGQLALLQKLSLNLINHYPVYKTEFQTEALVALEKSFYMLGLGDPLILESHIDKILYVGLLRTCSLITAAEMELMKETGQTTDSYTYKSYLSFWKYLLNLTSSPNLPVKGSFVVKKGVAVRVFDAFFSSFLRILSKLNFRVDAEMELEKPSDLHIFINMVDLYEDLIPLIDPFSLQKWLDEIFRVVIHLSRKNPLVSGFYKIAGASLKAADGSQFFDYRGGEKETSFELVKTFLEDILSKVDGFKGDLQVACLKVLLAAPTNLIEGFAERIIPALKVIIQLARSFPSLLKDLIETLERWDLFLPSPTSCAIMEKILPHFDIFFQSRYFRGSNSVDWSKAGRAVKNQVVFTDSEYLALQKKFLIFLGSLEIRKAMALIEVTDTEDRRNITDKPLVYLLPCNNGEVELNLEEIVPRIVDLAESCGDRKTRITACELLHSMFLVILGNVNQLSGGYICLFRKVLKSCLMLGCDSDGVVCQIFQPLSYQITHYFSGKQTFHFSETTVLIDVLMDFVACPYNPTLRDFSADLLREFTVWSIKQLTPEELKVTPESVKRILQKIYSLALHPSYNKRLGAAVLFNKIYSVLREEEFILKTYWFELFYYFMESLRMSDESEDVSEITNAIGHLKRPLLERRRDFNEDFSDRVVPPEFNGGRLCHLVKWTMERACDVKPAMRHTAMDLVQSLAPLVENCDAEMPFFSKQFQSFFKLRKDLSNLDEKDFSNWLKSQYAGFEYCTWLVEEKVLKTDEVFQPKLKAVLKSFICALLLHRENTIAVNHIKHQSVLSCLKLLCALKERAYLYPAEHWDLLKMAIFKSSQLGFDLNNEQIKEQLLIVLTSLLEYLSVHLTAYDWDYFCKNLDHEIVVPAFDQTVKSPCICVENLEFLFALKVIEGSGLWAVLSKTNFFLTKKDLLLTSIFNSLFISSGKLLYAVEIGPLCKLYLEEVLKVALSFTTNLDDVMTFLANEEEVREEETGKILKKGEFFKILFKDAIFSFLESKHNLLLEWVLRQRNVKALQLLVQILENHSENSDLSSEIFSRWQDFENLNIEETSEKNQALLNLVVSGARVIGTPGFLKGTPVAEKIYFILENFKLEEMKFSEVEALFSLLPFLSVFGESAPENDRLQASLLKLQLGMNALEISNGEFEPRYAHIALTGLLDSLKSTASLVVLNFIMSKAHWFDIVCRRSDVESALSAFAESRTPVGHCANALELAYDYCFEYEANDFLPSVIYKLFLAPLLKIASIQSVYCLVLKNMEKMSDLILTYRGTDSSSIDEILINIQRKTCVAELFQAFITKLPNEVLDEMPPEKKQVMVVIVREVFLLLKKPYPPYSLKEDYRKLMCQIFNMICCILSARCVDKKLYKLFIFDERGSFLFEAVQKNVKFNLGMDFDEIPKRKKHLTILRKAIAKESQTSFVHDSVKYIQTNTLFTSSLQEDVTRFDLTFSPLRPVDSVPQESTINVEIELEMDSLNSHECMPTLIATISKMVQDKITPIDSVTEVPCWLTFFVNVLKKPGLCENLKLFVLKAIYNIQEYVAPFCNQVFSSLVSFMLKFFADRPINYFLIDLIEMMAKWNCVSLGQGSPVELTKLVKLVLEKSDSLRRDIVRNNLEILKTVIEVWKSRLILTRLSWLAFKRLSASVEELTVDKNADSQTWLNLHICGILLSNGIPPWKEGSSRKFFNLILKGFRGDINVNKLFGKICGLALSHIEKTDASSLEECEALVQEKISSLGHSWLQVLYSVHQKHPRISSSFVFRILSSAWNSSDSLTVKKLEMLLSHVSKSEALLDPTFNRHACAFILDMLNSSDVAVHEVSLQIAEALLDKMENEKLQIFTLQLVRLQNSPDSGVRKWVYENCKKLYQQCSSDYVVRQCKIILLRGVHDSVSELSESCLKFWWSVLNFMSPDSIFLQVLKNMYVSETEEIFLSNTAKVILRFAVHEHKSQNKVFPHPITSNCKFRKRNLVFGTRQSFLLSLASSGRTLTNQSLEHVATIRQQNLPYLRPTISTLKFQPTAQENWEAGGASEVRSLEDSSVPTNPIKRRFYKKEGKTISFFAKLNNQEKKRIEESTEAKNQEVDVCGEYNDGDYPDIQISHSQILKLLGALTKTDHQMARLFLISFFDGLVKSTKPDLKTSFLSEAGKCFENILKTSCNFDPGVFGFVLQVILHHCKHFDIDSQLISNAAVSSNWISLGALIIEETITVKEGEDGEAMNKRVEKETSEEKRWLELAKLYRSLEEFDVLSGIFVDKLMVTGSAREAILCESMSDWQEATKHYESALQSEPKSTLTEFYTESYLTCLAKLSNWSSLNKCIRTTVNNDLNELWNNYNLLFWFLKSEKMISLGSEKNQFQLILEEFSYKTVRENILSSNFGEEMAVLDWLSGNLQRACHRIDKLCLDFLAEWSHLDRWSFNLRSAKLLRLQTLSELNLVVRSLAEVSESKRKENVQLALKRWDKNVPGPRDDLTIWDVKLGYRREFFRHLKDLDLRAFEVRSNLALARAALSQDNLHMAKECLSRAQKQLPEGDFDLKIEHSICFNLGKMVVAKFKMKDLNVGLKVYLNVWTELSKQISSAMETDSGSSRNLLYSCNYTLGHLVSEILPHLEKPTVSPEVFKLWSLKLKLNENDVTGSLRRQGLEYLETARKVLESESCSPETKSDVYLKLSKFFLKFPDSNTFKQLSTYLLKSMELGNSEARQLFGCLLNSCQLSTQEPSFEDVISESDRVPSWMFLSWINQILASLNSPIFPILKSILTRVTKDYPNAIRYALKLTEELDSFDSRSKSLLEKLRGILSKDQLYDDFWTSMNYVAPPHLILHHHLKDALQEASQTEPNYSRIKEIISYLQEFMFSADNRKFQGPAFKFWEQFEAPLKDLSDDLAHQDVLKNKLKGLLELTESAKMPSKKIVALEWFSPWLYNFHALKVDTELELPGQYDGNREPIKKYLVTVSSFKNQVLVIDSKCKPVRICVLGNDAKEHQFLVKFGEDLRQDERIQRVFSHFNQRLEENKQSRRFSIGTYKVIPLTLCLGMIEWVDNTVSLYEMIENSLGNDSDAIAKAQTAHLSFLSQGSPLAVADCTLGSVAAHLIAYENIAREKAITNFRLRVQEFPRDLLKRSFLNLSTCPEHFIHLRGNFATSHAIMCIVHWLVGIGDRHLQNTLVSTRTGRVLGVDFGYAFGFATQFLTPPELVPFRLSPQLLNLMHPLGESGWIKETMVHCLKIFRKESFRLQSLLEVFAQEPVMDWLKQAKKKPTFNIGSTDTWHPREKLLLVERKLNGANPVVVFEADLRAGHSRSKYLARYLEVLKGSPQHNVRARCDEGELSEKEQVECLVDLATDPHVLAKTYIGWNPWL